ncbi:F-box protein At5g65850-like [Arachis duranensis]|uniref:F-box protein At5g65850-like n=1 Tax=Arachis duranensis TaxID=130453 RepID=A0A6P4CMQ5_ARADU|nr:F-box protein At5g65850-like [Arachis duranensis]
MENKNQNDKSKSIHDILPLDLIHIILLLVPIRHLARLKCLSKLWCSLISDRDFAEFHFHHSPAATKACFFTENLTMAYLVYLMHPKKRRAPLSRRNHLLILRYWDPAEALFSCIDIHIFLWYGTHSLDSAKEYPILILFLVIPCKVFQPLLSSNGDIIGRGYDKTGPSSSPLSLASPNTQTKKENEEPTYK